VWCEYAWKMSVNSKGSTLSLAKRYVTNVTTLPLSIRTITGLLFKCAII